MFLDTQRKPIKPWQLCSEEEKVSIHSLYFRWCLSVCLTFKFKCFFDRKSHHCRDKIWSHPSSFVSAEQFNIVKFPVRNHLNLIAVVSVVCVYSAVLYLVSECLNCCWLIFNAIWNLIYLWSFFHLFSIHIIRDFFYTKLYKN